MQNAPDHSAMLSTFIKLPIVIKIFVFSIFEWLFCKGFTVQWMPGRVAQSVTCLATDACLTADPGVPSSIPVRSQTFVEIDRMISTVFSSLPLIHSRRVVVSYKRKYVHELLVNCLFKPAQEKVWSGELTVPQ